MAPKKRLEEIIANHIANVVEDRQISEVFHFTRLDCLGSILQHGLRNRSELLNAGYKFSSPRRDGADDAVSVSVSCYYPKMFEGKRAEAPDVLWAFLVLEPLILWQHHCLFYRYSALSNNTKYETGARHGGWALQKLFGDYSLTMVQDGVGFRDHHNLPKDFPTFAESEVQVFSPIDPSYIKGIWVETPDDENLVKNLLAATGRTDCRVIVHPFVPRIQHAAYAWG